MAKHSEPTLQVSDFAALFGMTLEEVLGYAGNLFDGFDLKYKNIVSVERDALILSILKKIYDENLQASGTNRQSDWEKGWDENLNEFVSSGYDVTKLIPKYFKKNVPIRLFNDYVLPADPDFVQKCCNIFRTCIFRKYFEPYENIYEFGCGSASNLARLAEIYPDKVLFGLDWASSSQEIINKLRDGLNINISGHKLDFFNPDLTFNLKEKSAVYTFGALEQVGARHDRFLNYLLAEKPSICVNVECLSELYDENILSDYLALRYHKRRNYLDSFLTSLKNKEESGLIAIDKVHHQQFGNMYGDTLSYVVWRPL